MFQKNDHSSRTLSYFLQTIVLIMPLLFIGCTSSAEDFADHMALKSLQSRHDMVLFEGDMAAFQTCLHHRGGDAGSCQADSALTALPNATYASGSVGGAASSSGSGGSSAPAPTKVTPRVQKSLDQLPANHPAHQAAAVLNHPLMQSAVDLHNQMRGHGSGSLETEEHPEAESSNGCQSTVHMPISVSNLHDLSTKLSSAANAGGWHALQDHVKSILAADQKAQADPQVVAEARKVTFIKTYIEAYFDNGHFLTVDFQVSATEAQADIVKFLQDHHPSDCTSYNAQQDLAAGNAPGSDTSCTALAQSIYRSAKGSAGDSDHTILQAKPKGYVPRDASSSSSRNQFPAIGVTLDPLAHHLVSVTGPHGEANYVEIGSDLLRITLEAIFDHHEALPVASGSTAASLSPALPIMPIGNIDVHDIAAMSRLNTRASSAAGIVTNRLVEGIGPMSLNNDALEDMITTLVTTSVYKAAEKATWCWYACNLNTDVGNLEKDAKTALKEKGEKFKKRLAEARDRSKKTCLAMHVSNSQ